MPNENIHRLKIKLSTDKKPCMAEGRHFGANFNDNITYPQTYYSC